MVQIGELSTVYDTWTVYEHCTSTATLYKLGKF